MIAIVDYGMGNLKSVQKALEKLNVPCQVTSSASDVAVAKKVIVPGVGAFGDAMKELANRKLIEPLKETAKKKVPMLGICLGLQVFFNTSEENPGIKGLELISGEVKRFSFDVTSPLRVPHIGWNTVQLKNQNRLFKSVPTESFFYFVHSFYCVPQDSNVTAATTDYGIRFTSAIATDHLFGVQFHPEKSQDLGLQILKNFASL